MDCVELGLVATFDVGSLVEVVCEAEVEGRSMVSPVMQLLFRITSW